MWRFAFLCALCRTLCRTLGSAQGLPSLCRKLGRAQGWHTLCWRQGRAQDHAQARTRYAQGRQTQGTRKARTRSTDPGDPCARHGTRTRAEQGLCRPICAQGCTRCPAPLIGNIQKCKPPYVNTYMRTYIMYIHLRIYTCSNSEVYRSPWWSTY